MQFDVLYFDPPWKFRNEKTGGSHTSGAAQKYAVLDLGTIHRLPVQAVAAPNSVMFLWVPTSMKRTHGFTTLDAWGFGDYKTTWYWIKEYQGKRMGMGFWGRNGVEELLIAVRGYVQPFGAQFPNWLQAPVGDEHSDKPDEMRRRIEIATGKISRRHCLEGFARKIMPGWTGIGNVVTGRDIREDLKLLAVAAAA